MCFILVYQSDRISLKILVWDHYLHFIRIPPISHFYNFYSICTGYWTPKIENLYLTHSYCISQMNLRILLASEAPLPPFF